MNKIFWVFFLVFLGSGMQGQAAESEKYEEEVYGGPLRSVVQDPFDLEANKQIPQVNSSDNLIKNREQISKYCFYGAVIGGCAAAFTTPFLWPGASILTYVASTIISATGGVNFALVVWSLENNQ